MRLLRIFAAYTYRLTRRHSTGLLIAFLIVTITIILQLYAHKYQEYRYSRPSIGDFEYRPGLFLQGKQPNENRSYCQFNYGLPDALKWGSFRVHPSPKIGILGSHRVIYNAIKGTAYANFSEHDAVTYVTQATPEYIYHVVEIARYWEGPISLSVYVPDYDLDITMQIMTQLCHCYPGMSKVSLHLFYTKNSPPRMVRDAMTVTTEAPPVSNVTVEDIIKIKMENYRRLDNKTRAEYILKARQNKIKRMMSRIPTKRTSAPYLTFDDCSGLESFDIPTYRREFNMIYPINVGRNSARKASTTNYFILSDIEMVPSDGLAPRFLAMLRKFMGDKKRDEGYIVDKTVFVVPLFEVDKGEEIPRNKLTLVQLISSNRATYFHQKTCSHCQRFPGMQSWLTRPMRDIVEPMLFSRREYPYHRWEPLYFGTNKEPWYSEMLSWEGRQDKMTQMLELCLQVYRLIILDGGFLCHAAVSNSQQHLRAKRNNDKQYQMIKEKLKRTYPDRFACRPDYWASSGCKS